MTGPSRDVPHYTEDEQRRLALNLAELLEQIHAGKLLDRHATLDLLCFLHRSLFNGVRDHAGQIRRPGFGSEYLWFGPNRSYRHTEVANRLLDIFAELQKAIASFDRAPDAPLYEESALTLAAWLHAEVIHVHPFEDGNGRTTRALMNWVLVRVGLRPIAVEAVRQEYLNCLNHFYAHGDRQPLVDLLIRLYPGIP